jgi:hypothetical protein
MSNTNGDNWSAQITENIQPGTMVYYYIKAQANSGKQMTRPMPAPEGYFDFFIMDPNVSSTNNEKENETLLNAYPNPASSITCIPIETQESSYASLEMYDIFGKKVTTIYEGLINTGLTNYFINAKNYSPGVYFLILNKGEDTLRKKIIIK